MGWGDQRRGFSDTVEVPELDLAVLFDNSQLVFKITGRERESPSVNRFGECLLYQVVEPIGTVRQARLRQGIIAAR